MLQLPSPTKGRGQTRQILRSRQRLTWRDYPHAPLIPAEAGIQRRRSGSNTFLLKLRPGSPLSRGRAGEVLTCRLRVIARDVVLNPHENLAPVEEARQHDDKSERDQTGDEPTRT